MERIGNKVSYIRKPLAKYSFVSAGLGTAALLFGCIAIGAAYYFQGDAPLSAAAVGFCSILTAVSAVVYGVLSFFEKEKIIFWRRSVWEFPERCCFYGWRCSLFHRKLCSS